MLYSFFLPSAVIKSEVCDLYLLDTDGRGGVRVELVGVNGTETSVTGLTPGVYYTFSVTAENAVSSQDNNINARTVRDTANTEEGGMHKQLHCIYIPVLE